MIESEILTMIAVAIVVMIVAGRLNKKNKKD